MVGVGAGGGAGLTATGGFCCTTGAFGGFMGATVGVGAGAGAGPSLTAQASVFATPPFSVALKAPAKRYSPSAISRTESARSPGFSPPNVLLQTTAPSASVFTSQASVSSVPG